MSKELIRLSDCSMVFDDDVILNNINSVSYTHLTLPTIA